MKVENMKTKLKISPGAALFHLTKGIKLTLQPIHSFIYVLFWENYNQFWLHKASFFSFSQS